MSSAVHYLIEYVLLMTVLWLGFRLCAAYLIVRDTRRWLEEMDRRLEHEERRKNALETE